jgi:branched-chain amino acid transport system substrate-binding protein
MVMRPWRLFAIVTAAVLVGLPVGTVSPEAVQRPSVVLGMSAALSGPSGQLGRGMRVGIEAYLQSANDAGGIQGRTLRLVALDDAYQAEPVRDNMLRLIDRENVLAVIGSVGTPGAVVAVPIANERKTLLFGAFSGADVLRRSPPDRYVINFRASYAEETGVMVRGLLRRGIKPQQIAFFTQNDAYGDSGYEGAVAALKAVGYPDAESLAHGRYERGTLDVADALLAIMQARVRPRAIIMVGSYGASAKFISLARQAMSNVLYLNVSFVGSEALIAALGPDSEGVIITQVVPHYDADLPAVTAYRAALARYFPGTQPGPVSLEGFLAARTLGRALSAAPAVTRDGLIEGFYRLGTVDIGVGVPLRFSPEQHQGSHHVWLTTVRNGTLVPFEW